MNTSKRKIWTAELQMNYPEITQAALSPDGTSIVYTVKQALMKKTKSTFITHLFLVSSSGGEPIQLTYGETSNSSPTWSPDSQNIAFLSNRTGRSNIHIIGRNGGEPWALTEYKKTDISYVEWAPDGLSLAFLMPKPTGKKKSRALLRKDDAVKWDIDYDFSHVFWVPFASGGEEKPTIKQLTRGRFHTFGMAWMPTGDAIAIIHQPTPLAEDWPKSRLAVIPLNTDYEIKPFKQKALNHIATVSTWGGLPYPSPDGTWIAVATPDSPLTWAGADRVVLYPTDGSKPRFLSPTPDGQAWIIGWSFSGDRVYVGETIGLDTYVSALPIDGGDPDPVLHTPTFKSACHTSGHNMLVYTEETFHRPNSLWLLDVDANLNAFVTAPALPLKWPDVEMPEVDVLHWKAQDGLDIEGYVIYPLDYSPGRRYPLIVEVHGGPMSVFNRRYLGWPGRYCDALAAAEGGFIVLRVNPRGSSGYGKEFRLANYEDWGYGDYRDILSGIDLLIAKGLVDPERMGIMGWSYGGFMTSWAITQTKRFKAACVGAGVTNLMSFNGTSDIPGFIPDYFRSEFWDNPKPYRRHSPLFNVKDVSTPTLIQHGTIDERVPLEQGLQLYNALKRQQVPVEMILYPRQHHSIAEPRLRVDMRKRPIAWFMKWLPEDGPD